MDLCPVFQGLATSLSLYKKEPTKRSQKETEHQLDLVLTLSSNGRQLGVKSKSIILGNDVIVSGLTDLIEGRCHAPHLVHKALMILSYLVLDRDVLEHLLTHSVLVLRLARFLVNSRDPLHQSSLVQCFKLLQALTYKLTVICPNGHIEDILEFCVHGIVSGSSEEERTAYLEIISNLSFANVSVQAYLKGLSTASALNRMLISNMKDDSLAVIILSLSILSNLWLNEDLGMRIFNGKNIEQTFQLIFKLICQSPERMEDSHLVVRSAVDLFCSITHAARIQNALEEYQLLPKCLQTICKLVPIADVQRARILLELLLSMCKIEKPTNLLVRTVFFEGDRSPPSAFLDILAWIAQPLQHGQGATFLAIDLLRELFEVDPGPSSVISHLAPALSKQLSVAISCLRAERNELPCGSLYLTKLTKLLHLTSTVSKHSLHLQSLSSAISEQSLIELYTFILTSSHSLFAAEDESEKDPNRKADTIQLLLATIKILSSLKSAKPLYQEAYQSVLEDPRLLPYLSYALTHSAHRETLLSLELLREALQMPNFHISNFGNILASTSFNQRELVKQLNVQLNTQLPSKPSEERKQAGSPLKLDSASVDDSIKRMRSGFSLSEMRNTDIIDIYEYKLSTLDTKVTQLEALLEAKSLSLQQSERLVAQLRCKLADSESECQNLSNSLSQFQTELVREEGRAKSLAEREKELNFENESLQREVCSLKEMEVRYLQVRNDVVDKNKICENLASDLKRETALSRNLQKEREGLEENVQTLRSQQERLLEQIKEIEADKQKYKQRLAEEEKVLKELEVNAAQQCTKYSQIERQLAETTAERDTLAKQMVGAHKSKESLQERLNALQSENIQMNSELQIEREGQKLTKAQLEKMQQLTAMIHNLSSTGGDPHSQNLKRKTAPNE